MHPEAGWTMIPALDWAVYRVPPSCSADNAARWLLSRRRDHHRERDRRSMPPFSPSLLH